MQRGAVAAEKSRPAEAKTAHDASWREIQEALRGLQYGSVTVVVQDGLIVQVERLEKRRLLRKSAAV
jgi:hypothetical protein